MKKYKISTLIITSVIMLSACQTNGNSTSPAASEEISVDIETTSISLTHHETSVFEIKYDEQPVTETMTETAAEISITQPLTETETEEATTHTETDFSEIIASEHFDEETSAPQNEEKTKFHFDIDDTYAERFVENLTGDAELFALYNDALFIYRELYTGIGMTAEKVFVNHGSVDDSTGLVSTGVAYSDYEQFLGLYFTDDFIAELEDSEFIINVDGEVYYNEWYMGARGGDFFFNGAELRISEQTDDLITLKLKINFRDESDPDSTRTVRTDTHRLYVVKTDDGWRFDDMHSVC